MPRRYSYNRRRRTTRRRNSSYRRRRTILMKPGVQVSILLVVALIIFIILQNGGSGGGAATNTLAPDVSVTDAYAMYQNGAFVLDVRNVDEWNEFRAPNTTLIPLGELTVRFNEVPRDREIVVVCRSVDCSQQGRDILLNAGFVSVTSMTVGLNEWRALGYPTEP